MMYHVKTHTLYILSVGSLILFISVLGIVSCITPQYHFINHTISRLAIEKYGIWQKLNLFQFSLGIYSFGLLLSRYAHKSLLKRIFIHTGTLLAMSQIITALFPTDPIENIPFSFSLLTATGTIHFLTVFFVLGCMPIGISILTHAMRDDAFFKPVSHFTALTGAVTFILSMLWILFFTMGWFLAWRGLFEKIIVLILLFWMGRIIFLIKSEQSNRALAESEEYVSEFHQAQ